MNIMIFHYTLIMVNINIHRKCNITAAALAVILCLTAFPAYAQEYAAKSPVMPFSITELKYAGEHPDFFTLDPNTVTNKLLGISEKKDFAYLGTDKVNPQFAVMIIDQIVNITYKVWDLVVRNAAVVNIESKYATAVPQGTSAWSQLTEWQKPKSAMYEFSIKNTTGMKVIDVQYEVVYTHGGKCNGKGQYLTGVSVVPVKVQVAWGFRFTINVEVPDTTVVNIGTSENPIAALQLIARYKAASSVKQINWSEIYYITGAGEFSELTNKLAKDVDMREEVNAQAGKTFNLDIDKVFEN